MTHVKVGVLEPDLDDAIKGLPRETRVDGGEDFCLQWVLELSVISAVDRAFSSSVSGPSYCAVPWEVVVGDKGLRIVVLNSESLG